MGKKTAENRKGQCFALHESVEEQGMRRQLRETQDHIAKVAASLACPLKIRKRHNTPTSHTCASRQEAMQVQMDHVARASDGYFYDFDHICAYITANWGTRLVSPVTGERMLAQVIHMVPTRGKAKFPMRAAKWAPWVS